MLKQRWLPTGNLAFCTGCIGHAETHTHDEGRVTYQQIFENHVGGQPLITDLSDEEHDLSEPTCKMVKVDASLFNSRKITLDEGRESSSSTQTKDSVMVIDMKRQEDVDALTKEQRVKLAHMLTKNHLIWRL